MEWFTQQNFGLYNWMWLLIALVIVVLVIVIIVVCAKKKAKKMQPVASEQIEEVDAVEEKSVEVIEEKPADAVEEEDNMKKTEPAAKPATTEKKAAPAAKPAEKKAAPVAKPAPSIAAKTEAKPEAKTDNRPKVYHISLRKSDGMWQVKAAGAEKAIKLFRTQQEAIDYCKPLAVNQDANIMIHKKDGSFRKLTY